MSTVLCELGGISIELKLSRILQIVSPYHPSFFQAHAHATDMFKDTETKLGCIGRTVVLYGNTLPSTYWI